MQEFIESLKEKSDDQLKEIICDYAEKGDLEKVKFMLTNPTIDTYMHFSDNSGILSLACFGGNIDLVRYLLTSPEPEQHFDINADDDYALSCACEAGHLAIVKYLIESPELKIHSKVPFVNVANKNPIFLSAKYKHLEMFEYLASVVEGKDDSLDEHFFKAGSQLGSSNDLNLVKSFIKVGENKSTQILTSMLEGVINGACSKDDMEVIKYVFSSPHLAQHIDIHKDNDIIFRNILMWSKIGKGLDVARYFIFDLNIQETERIKKLRASIPYDDIEKMFNVRDLTKTLNQELSPNKNIKKPNKI